MTLQGFISMLVSDDMFSVDSTRSIYLRYTLTYIHTIISFIPIPFRFGLLVPLKLPMSDARTIVPKIALRSFAPAVLTFARLIHNRTDRWRYIRRLRHGRHGLRTLLAMLLNLEAKANSALNSCSLGVKDESTQAKARQ